MLRRLSQVRAGRLEKFLPRLNKTSTGLPPGVHSPFSLEYREKLLLSYGRVVRCPGLLGVSPLLSFHAGLSV